MYTLPLLAHPVFNERLRMTPTVVVTEGWQTDWSALAAKWTRGSGCCGALDDFDSPRPSVLAAPSWGRS